MSLFFFDLSQNKRLALPQEALKCSDKKRRADNTSGIEEPSTSQTTTVSQKTGPSLKAPVLTNRLHTFASDKINALQHTLQNHSMGMCNSGKLISVKSNYRPGEQVWIERSLTAASPIIGKAFLTLGWAKLGNCSRATRVIPRSRVSRVHVIKHRVCAPSAFKGARFSFSGRE